MRRTWDEPAAGVPLLGSDRTSICYRSRRPEDALIRARLRKLAAVRRRFSWRRLKVLLSREGVDVNHVKLRHLYPEEGLHVRPRIGRKRAAVTRVPLLQWRAPTSAGRRTSCTPRVMTGRLRILAVVDDYTRKSLCLVADLAAGRSSDLRAGRHDCLARVALAMRLEQWPRVQRPGDARVGASSWSRMALHRSGQAAPERLHRELHGQLRAELLNETLFTSLAQTRIELEQWRNNHNTESAQSALGNLKPAP